MCGILGSIPPLPKEKFKKALDELLHRGPDSYGIKVVGDNAILGHRRLSIIDLSKQADQPMQDITKRYTLIFNGEIYNFLELRSELLKKGHNFQTNSDSEVLLYAYIQWGSDCLKKLNGMWSFAIYDSLKKEIFLSRDRFGKKPLFYLHDSNRFIFASEMKALFPFMNDVSMSPNFQALKKNIFGYESTEKCLIDGIKRFPAGSYGTFKDNSLKIIRYWNTLDNLVDVPDSYNDQVDQFRDIFFDACKIRMRSDVTLGTALSGGLDSSAVISSMAHVSKKSDDYTNLPGWQNAVIASFPGTPLDETSFAKKVLNNINVRGDYVEINPLDYWGNLNKYTYLFEELYITSPIPMISVYEKLKANGITVTLDGHGADDMLSGYGHLLEALWDNWSNTKLVNEIIETHQNTILDDKQFKKYNKFLHIGYYFSKKIFSKITNTESISIDHKHPEFQKFDNLNKSLYILFHETVMPTLLRNYDRYSMINSVEIRMPFLDHRLVSFVNSLPSKSKYGNGYTKKILRDSLKGILPDEVLWRKSKVGFNTPIVNWMQNDLSEWFMDTVSSFDFQTSKAVTNPKKIQAKVVEIVSKKNNDYKEAQKIWAEISSFIWEQALIKRIY